MHTHTHTHTDVRVHASTNLCSLFFIQKHNVVELYNAQHRLYDQHCYRVQHEHLPFCCHLFALRDVCAVEQSGVHQAMLWWSVFESISQCCAVGWFHSLMILMSSLGAYVSILLCKLNSTFLHATPPKTLNPLMQPDSIFHYLRLITTTTLW